MAIQNVVNTPLDGGLRLSIRQTNVQVDRLGEQATATKMYESLPHNTNTGSETKTGTSEFQRDNEELIEVSVEKMAEIMERDDQLTEVSNSGSETNFEPSGFQQANDISFNAQQQAAANAYSYYNT